MRANRSRVPGCRDQRGAVLVTVALVTFVLLGFIGVALDTGRLFVTKSELQTAMDSCALAAAAELNQATGALARARSAGNSAAQKNRVGFQSANWGGLGQSVSFTFRDTNYNTTTSDSAAIYVECQHTHAGQPTWILQALAAADGGTAARFPATRTVAASAVATRGSAQTTCPVPLALRPKTAGAAGPNYGYAVGDWVTMLIATNDTGTPGYIGWANLDGSNSASETVAEMNGHCGVTVGTMLGTPGVQSTVYDNWNWRFGMYKNGQAPTDAYAQPDQTGYVYTTKTWPAGRAAYGDFIAKRAAFANCLNTATVNNQSVKNCDTATGLSLNGGIKTLLTSGLTGGHHQYGGNRRVVLVPVTTSYPGSVADYVCMLMLQPISIPKADVQLEFLGNASAANSPCTTSGLPGGAAGPLVPVLVR